jgi:membrane protein YdbS with pleckstrin-like domain
MENSTPVSKNALQYRLTMNECMGVIIALAVTVLIAITFYFIKLKHAVLYDVLAFLVILVLQFVILYFVSLMQYKNLRYTIGQNAISFQRGAFGIERETIPFEKIKNSTFDQTLLQRLFSVGDITIDQEEEKYIWEDIDSHTASLISDAVSAKGDVQPITVAAATAILTPPPPQNTQ